MLERSTTLDRRVPGDLSLLEMDRDREGDDVFSIREEEEEISVERERSRRERWGGGEEQEWINAIGQGEEGERTYLASLSLSFSLPPLPCHPICPFPILKISAGR